MSPGRARPGPTSRASRRVDDATPVYGTPPEQAVTGAADEGVQDAPPRTRTPVIEDSPGARGRQPGRAAPKKQRSGSGRPRAKATLAGAKGSTKDGSGTGETRRPVAGEGRPGPEVRQGPAAISSSSKRGAIIAAVVFALVVLVVVLANLPTGGGDPYPDDHAVVDPAAATGALLPIDTWIEYDDGVRMKVGEPRAITADDLTRVGAYAGLLEVEITIANGSDADLEPRVYPHILSGNVEGESIYALSDDAPDEIAAGATYAYKTVFGVRDPTSFVLRLSPGFDYDDFSVEWSTGEPSGEPATGDRAEEPVAPPATDDVS